LTTKKVGKGGLKGHGGDTVVAEADHPESFCLKKLLDAFPLCPPDSKHCMPIIYNKSPMEA